MDPLVLPIWVSNVDDRNYYMAYAVEYAQQGFLRYRGQTGIEKLLAQRVKEQLEQRYPALRIQTLVYPFGWNDGKLSQADINESGMHMLLSIEHHYVLVIWQVDDQNGGGGSEEAGPSSGGRA